MYGQTIIRNFNFDNILKLILGVQASLNLLIDPHYKNNRIFKVVIGMLVFGDFEAGDRGMVAAPAAKVID